MSFSFTQRFLATLLLCYPSLNYAEKVSLHNPTEQKVKALSSAVRHIQGRDLSDIILKNDEIEKLKKLGIEFKEDEPNGWSLQICGKDGPRISMKHGNIAKIPADFIVNAANTGLRHGGGVCGAIFTAAGAFTLKEACSAFPKVRGMSSFVSDAKMTPAFYLSGDVIIHAVGPNMNPKHSERCYPLDEATTLLEKVYKNIFYAADTYIEAVQNNKKLDATLWPPGYKNAKDVDLLRKIKKGEPISISIPLISTGVFNFPQKDAVKISLSTILRYILSYEGKTPVRNIQLIVFPDKQAEISKEEHISFLKETLGILN